MMCSDAFSGAVMGTWLQSVCLDLSLFVSLSLHTGTVDTMHLVSLCSSALSHPHLVLQHSCSAASLMMTVAANTNVTEVTAVEFFIYSMSEFRWVLGES